MKSSLTGLIFSIAVLVGAVSEAYAQSYPSRPLNLIVTFPAGSNSDILARFLGQRLTESWGQQVVIHNRGGGNTVIGTEMAAKAAPDGYTLFIGQAANMIIVPALFDQGALKKLPYDTAKDLEPVAYVGVTPSVLGVYHGLPVKSVAELIALAKSRPGKLNYASSGSGGTTHLVMEMFKQMTGTDMVHIPFVGPAKQMTAMAAGEVDLGLTAMLAVLPHIKAGRIRGLAVSNAKRSPAAPDIPTLAEAGVTGFQADSWYGVLVPSGTPRDIVIKLNAEINKVLRDTSVKERLSTQGIDVDAATPEQFGAFLKEEWVRWTRVVKVSGAKID